MMEIEKRFVKTKFDVKTTGDTITLSGMPIVYNRDSVDMGFIERILPGSTADALENSDIRLLYGHNSDTLLPLARSASRTMRIFDTPDGVRFEATAPNTQFARDLAESIQRGDVSQMSFAFRVVKDTDVWEERDGKLYRTVTKMKDLFDFSFITFAAYPDTTADVAMRSFKSFKEKSSATAGNNTSATADENRDIDIRLLTQKYRN